MVLSATHMLVDLFVTVMKVNVSVAIMRLEVMQIKVSAANMWVIIFIEIMQVGVSCCNHAGGIFYNALCS